MDTLPDGSKVIVDPNNETVFALNATAGVAWDACSRPTTLSKVTEEMRRSLDPNVSEDLALEAILQLQERKLVTTSASASVATRRGILTAIGGIALPIVACLTLAEQRAHSEMAVSATGCLVVQPSLPQFAAPLQEPSPPPTTAAPTTPCP